MLANTTNIIRIIIRFCKGKHESNALKELLEALTNKDQERKSLLWVKIILFFSFIGFLKDQIRPNNGSIIHQKMVFFTEIERETVAYLTNN